MSGASFNRDFALENWRERYPDEMELIKQLRWELYDCRDVRPVLVRNNTRLRGYPETAKCIEEMLEALGEGAV